ncbi:MAG: hypothetical protein KGL39_25240 [Patescibacteria group bacterium]|nr:hypothetical protein [Patescibacteria group bacterium]
MSNDQTEEKRGDALAEAVGAAVMAHGVRNGALDYTAVATVFLLILADIIGVQGRGVRKQMLDDFDDALVEAVRVRAAREVLARTVPSGSPH